MGVNITVNRKTKLTVNGVEYDSIDQLPPDVRDAYDKALKHAKVTATMSFTIDGQPASIDEVPSEVRGLVTDAFGERKSFPAWAVLLLLLALAAIAASWFRAR